MTALFAVAALRLRQIHPGSQMNAFKSANATNGAGAERLEWAGRA